MPSGVPDYCLNVPSLWSDAILGEISHKLTFGDGARLRQCRGFCELMVLVGHSLANQRSLVVQTASERNLYLL